MLIHRAHFPGITPARQQGVILMIALIMLIAMTLAGLALFRSTDTANFIAGNLAFQQATASAADKGIEQAITTLENTIAADIVANPAPTTTTPAWTWRNQNGYAATLNAPVEYAGGSWDGYWRNTLSAVPNLVVNLNGGAPDAFGNRISYVVQRLCRPPVASVAPWDPSDPNNSCSRPAAVQPPCNSEPCVPAVSSQVNYRITVRVLGPRNTTSYVQVIVGI